MSESDLLTWNSRETDVLASSTNDASTSTAVCGGTFPYEATQYYLLEEYRLLRRLGMNEMAERLGVQPEQADCPEPILEYATQEELDAIAALPHQEVDTPLKAIRRHLIEELPGDRRLALNKLTRRYGLSRDDANRAREAIIAFLRESRVTWNFSLDRLDVYQFIQSRGRILTAHDRYDAEIDDAGSPEEELDCQIYLRTRVIVETDHFHSPDLFPDLAGIHPARWTNPTYFALDWMQHPNGGARQDFGSSYVVLKNDLKPFCTVTPFDTFIVQHTRMEALRETEAHPFFRSIAEATGLFVADEPFAACYYDVSMFPFLDRLIVQLLDQDVLPDVTPKPDPFCRLDPIVERATDIKLTPEQKISAERAISFYGEDNSQYIEVQCHRNVNIFDDAEFISFSVEEIQELMTRPNALHLLFENIRESTNDRPNFIRYHTNTKAELSAQEVAELGLP